MNSITIKLDDALFAEFEEVRAGQHYTKTEFIKEAIRQRILDDKIKAIRKITGSYKGKPDPITRKQRMEAFKELGLE